MNFTNFLLLTIITMSKELKKASFALNYRLTIVLAIIILIALLIGLAISLKTNTMVDKKIVETIEAERPANIEIISITAPDCADCFNLAPFIETIKELNVKVENEEILNLSDNEAQKLIKQFNITKVPVVLVRGEIKKDKTLESFWNKIGKIEEDVFILTQNGVPYVLAATGEVKGRVQITLITDSTCTECYNVAVHESILKRFGLSMQDKNIAEVNSPDAQQLINKYNIQFVPMFVLIGDVAAYQSLRSIWSSLGTVEEDGAYIFREGVKQMGAYKDLYTGEVVMPKK